MGYVTLTSETLRNFAKAVGEIDWAAEGMSFLGQVNSQSRYSSHMPRGAFIDLVRTAMEETLRQTGRYPLKQESDEGLFILDAQNTEREGINQDKIDVVYNGVEDEFYCPENNFEMKRGCKVVLFLGRITLQKGPDYFVYAAKKVLQHEKNARFVIAGNGDMEPFIIEKAAEMGIADKVLFAGFLQGEDLERAYKMADVYVMPSVSEPFGITPLEAMSNNVPVIISRQSGVSEVIRHCLLVDFWDIDEMANKIASVLEHPSLRETLATEGGREVRAQAWSKVAQRCMMVYKKLVKSLLHV